MRRFKKPSPALVVAIVALVSSFTGTTMAQVIITSSSQVQNGVLTGADLATGTVKSVDVAGLTGADIQNGSLPLGKLAPADVATLLRTDSAAGGDLQGTFASLQLAPNTVAAAEIADGTVGAAEIATNGVAAAEIADGTVGAAEIATNGVAAAEIQDGTVGAAEIGDGTVGAAELGANSVTVGDMRLFYQDFRDFNYAGVLTNNTCSTPQTLQPLTPNESSFMTQGAYTIVTNNSQIGNGWEVEGLFTTSAGNAYVRVCNYTGASADPPNIGLNTMTFHA